MTELTITGLWLYSKTHSITLNYKMYSPDPALLKECWEQSIAQFQLMQQQYQWTKWIEHKEIKLGQHVCSSRCVALAHFN